MKKIFQTALPDILAIAAFVALSFLFFSPVLEGKVMNQGDMNQVKGMARELEIFKEQTGETSMWTNSMFGGMPSYLIKGGKTYNIFHSLQPVMRLYLPYYSVGILFVYLMGFYFLLRVLKIIPLLSFLGAVAFAFGSYNLIIIAAGHITKAYAIGYMAPALAGVLLIFQRRYLWGGIISMFAIGIQISANHYQITYYTFLIIALFILFQLYENIREKKLPHFFISTAIVAGAVLFSVLPNITNLWTISEYGKYSTRGNSELSDEFGQKSKALPKDYILNDYSFGISEPVALLVPNFKGGPSVSELGTNSEVYKQLLKNRYPPNEAKQVIKRMPTYYGPQLSTAGPVYAGAIVVFLFVLAMFLLNAEVKWWIFTAIALSIALAWGKNFYILSDLFIDYFPAYGKFRTVSMIMAIASLLLPFAAALGLNSLIRDENKKKDLIKPLKYSLYITGGFLLIIGLFGPSVINFTSASDSSLPDAFIKAIHADRGSLLRSDAFRSLGFIVAGAFIIWIYIKNKISATNLLIILSVLILIDLWSVDKRYVNESDFLTPKVQKNQFSPTAADLQILKDTSYYRVMNLTVNTFNDASTSYFHKSIGGYHGAKMKRYQDLIERQISRNNMEVLNMLNTKYFITPGENAGNQVVNLNNEALGNSWFADSLIWVDTPDQEMNTLSNFNAASQAVLNKKFATLEGIDQISPKVPNDTIYLTNYKPDELIYTSKASGQRFAVFSEIYYPKGWEVYIDGKATDYAQVNYVLRGMVIPEGEHTIRFYFHPKSFYHGHNIALGSSILSILLLLVGIAWKMKYSERKEAA